MFDRENDISKSLMGDSGSSAGSGALAALLADGEEPQYVLSSGSGIEHTSSGRTMTVEVGGDQNSYVVVTDERVLFLLGEEPSEAEIVFPLADVVQCEATSGFLSDKIVVETGDESVKFVPSEGDMEAAAEYVHHIGNCWEDLEEALAGIEASIERLEEQIRAGEDASEMRLQAQSRLSKAHHCATRRPEAPTEKMAARIQPLEADLDEARIRSWLDRAESHLETAERSHDDYDSACEAYATAVDSLENARDALDEADYLPDGVRDRVSDLEERLQRVGTGLLDSPESDCLSALEADDAGARVAAWSDALDRYESAVDAGLNGEAGVTEEALEFQLTWVTTSLLDALAASASEYERQGDECGDDEEARECYATAEQRLERARDLSQDRSRDPDRFAERIEQVTDKKLDRSDWEWGSA